MEQYKAVAYERKDGSYRATSHYAKDPKKYTHENPKHYIQYMNMDWRRWDITIDGVYKIWGSSNIEKSLRYYEREEKLPKNSVVLIETVAFESNSAS